MIHANNYPNLPILLPSPAFLGWWVVYFTAAKKKPPQIKDFTFFHIEGAAGRGWGLGWGI